MASTVTERVIISIPEVPNFPQLTQEAASNILYDQVIPACEKEGIKLSTNSYQSATDSPRSIERYNQEKAARRLFEITIVQKAFSSLSKFPKDGSSYSLQQVVQQLPNDQYFFPGTIIVSMLLQGYQAQFGKENRTIEFTYKNIQELGHRGGQAVWRGEYGVEVYRKH